MKIFSASLDNLSKILTGVLAPVFLLMPWFIWGALRTQQDKQYEGMLIGLAVLLAATFVLTYLMMPLNYVLDGDTLKINAKLGAKQIKLADISKVQRISKEDLGFVIRILGNGGLFGYTGFFTAKDFGRMRWFVTRKDNIVLISLKDETKIAISPDDVEGFLKTLKL